MQRRKYWQIINQYKSLNKDYKIRKKNNQQFYLYTKNDLEYEEKKKIFKYNINYKNINNSLKKNNSDFLKFPKIKRNKETNNDNNTISSYKNKSIDYNINNLIKREPSRLMKFLSCNNFFFLSK